MTLVWEKFIDESKAQPSVKDTAKQLIEMMQSTQPPAFSTRQSRKRRAKQIGGK